MQTTTLLVKVSTPQGQPAKGATVTARLSSVGIDALGYIDKSHAEAKADSSGVASLKLWPSATGTTDAEYRITARGSDGGRLIDTLVTIPESDAGVWLHDIVMLPPPTAKPYDEASIQAIQQARIDTAAYAASAISARDSALSYAIDAGSSIAEAQGMEIVVRGLKIEAVEAAEQASRSASIATASEDIIADAKEIIVQATSDTLINSSEAKEAVINALTLLGGAAAITQAVNSTSEDAISASQSEQAATQASEASSASALEAQQSMIYAQGQAALAEQSSRSANASLLAAQDNLNSVILAREEVDDLVIEAGQANAAAKANSSQVAQAAAASLNRSAGLIAHAENMRAEISGDRQAAESATDQAIAVLGSAQGIDEAVQVTYANRSIVDVSASEAMINTLAVRDAAAASRANRDKSDASAKEAKISELAAKSSLDDVSQLATYAAISAFQTAADRSVTQAAADRSESNLISIQASAVSVAANTVIATQKASEATASKDASKLSEQASEQSRILSSQASVSAITHKQAAIAAASIAVDGAQLVESLAIQVASDKEAAGQSAMAAAQVATDALNSSNTLIQQAQAASLDISESARLVSAATSNAIALLGGVEAVDEAVQLTYANRAIIDIALSNNLIVLTKVTI